MYSQPTGARGIRATVSEISDPVLPWEILWNWSCQRLINIFCKRRLNRRDRSRIFLQLYSKAIFQGKLFVQLDIWFDSSSLSKLEKSRTWELPLLFSKYPNGFFVPELDGINSMLVLTYTDWATRVWLQRRGSTQMATHPSSCINRGRCFLTSVTLRELLAASLAMQKLRVKRCQLVHVYATKRCRFI